MILHRTSYRYESIGDFTFVGAVEI